MALGWDLAAQAQLAGGHVRPAILLRVASDPVVRIWAGVGDIAIAADLIEDEDGAIYTGMGDLLPTPDLNALVNGLAERVDFQLSGVSSEVAAMASTEAESLRGVAVNVGFFVFGPDMQQLSPTAWLWDGEADSFKVDRQNDEMGAGTRTIALSVGSIFTGRKRSMNAYWTDADQRRRSAGDGFCRQVRSYSGGSTKLWPI